MYAVKLADIYDAIYHFKDYGRDVAWLLDAIRTHHPQGKTLLETACGTGRFLEHLRNHFQVEGQDLSEEMLARATQRVPGVPLHQGDMANFALPGRYDVVCCLFRSIAYVKTLPRFHDAIRCMARQVAPGGLLVIEPFFTPDTFRVGDVTLNEYRDERMKISWMYCSEKRSDQLGVFDIHYLVGTAAGVDHFTETHELGLFTPADYAAAFGAAGLQLVYDPAGPAGTGIYIGKKA